MREGLQQRRRTDPADSFAEVLFYIGNRLPASNSEAEHPGST